MSLNTAALYNQPDFSDITIRFGEQEVYCHKLVLCNNSEYFRKLCAPGSHFAECKQKIVELKGDDPVAVELMLRYIYTKTDLNEEYDRDWRVQLELKKTANKYLIHDLADIAFAKFKIQLELLYDPKDIFEAITHIRNSSSEDDILAVAEALQERHLLGLMSNEDFRTWLDNNPDDMWKHLDELSNFKSGLSRYYMTWCSNCRRRELVTAATRDSPPTRCNRPRCTDASPESLLSVLCWMPEPDANTLKRTNEISNNLEEVEIAWCRSCSKRSSNVRREQGGYCTGPLCDGSLVFTSCWVPKYLTESYACAWENPV